MNKPILPAKPEDAVRKLIEITRELKGLMEEEARHIAGRNEIGLMGTTDRKEEAAGLYTRAAQEFRARREEFRGIDKKLLDTLQAEQEILVNMTKDNQAVFDAMKKTPG